MSRRKKQAKRSNTASVKSQRMVATQATRGVEQSEEASFAKRRWRDVTLLGAIFVLSVNALGTMQQVIELAPKIGAFALAWNDVNFAFWNRLFATFGISVGELTATLLTKGLALLLPVYGLAILSPARYVTKQNDVSGWRFSNLVPFGIIWLAFTAPYINLLLREGAPAVGSPSLFAFAGSMSTAGTYLAAKLAVQDRQFGEYLWFGAVAFVGVVIVGKLPALLG